MAFRQSVAKYLFPIVRSLPHQKLRLPYPHCPDIRVSFYLDTELGLWLGYNEPSVIDWWTQQKMEDSVVFDVGAYTGIYTLLAATNGAQSIHAFEPDPSSAARIREQSEMNNFSNIIINESILSDEEGEQELFMNPEHRQHSLVTESHTDVPRQLVDSMTVDAYTPSPDFLKVDVEGAAAQVIEGAQETISQVDSTWVIEIHNDDEREAIESYFKGYTRNNLGDRHVVLTPQ